MARAHPADDERERVRVASAATPLKALRRTRTLTQLQMARLLGVSQQTYSKYESGVIRPEPVLRARIAAILGVSVQEVWPERRSSRPRSSVSPAVPV